MAKKDELIMTCLAYETLFDDYTTIDIKRVVSGIPYLAALNFIVAKHNRFYYCPSDLEGQKNELYELRCSFFCDNNVLQRLDIFILGQDNPYLIDNISTLYFELFILQYADKQNKILVLNPEQKVSVYKLYLYCSSLWLGIQQKGIENIELLDLNLKVDIPVTEFKFPADFHAQLYKANEFFVFCENATPHDTISQWLIRDKGKNNYQEYLLDVFELFRHTISGHILKKSNLPLATHWFLDNYCFNLSNQEDLCSDRNKGVRYLRNHFFVQIDNDSFILLNPTFLIDKFYQGLVFDAWGAIERRKGQESIADSIKDFTVLKSMLGRPFSEEHLFYSLMDKCFTSSSQIRKKGSELTGVEAPPDYYLRDGNNIFFFECKDMLINNDVRYSTDVSLIKNEILARICKDGSSNRKGGAQLLFTIDKYINENSLSKFDRPYSIGDNIYPILVTTDCAYDAYGVNLLMLMKFIEIIKEKYDYLAGKLKCPIIINMNCFVTLMNDLHKGNIKFNELLDDYQSQYLQKSEMRIMPSFYHYIRRIYHGKNYTMDELRYLFDSLFNSLAKILGKSQN